MRIYAVSIMGGTHHNIVLSIGDGWQAVIHEWKMSEIKLERYEDGYSTLHTIGVALVRCWAGGGGCCRPSDEGIGSEFE
jgi:hypothetical protein